MRTACARAPDVEQLTRKEGANLCVRYANYAYYYAPGDAYGVRTSVRIGWRFVSEAGVVNEVSVLSFRESQR
jgi:hypothetical protein